MLAAVAPAQVPSVGPAVSVASAPVLAAGTPVELMVVNEVSTKVAKPGDRFVLRVNAPVVASGATLIPVGTLGLRGTLHASGGLAPVSDRR